MSPPTPFSQREMNTPFNASETDVFKPANLTASSSKSTTSAMHMHSAAHSSTKLSPSNPTARKSSLENVSPDNAAPRHEPRKRHHDERDDSDDEDAPVRSRRRVESPATSPHAPNPEICDYLEADDREGHAQTTDVQNEEEDTLSDLDLDEIADALEDEHIGSSRLNSYVEDPDAKRKNAHSLLYAHEDKWKNGGALEDDDGWEGWADEEKSDADEEKTDSEYGGPEIDTENSPEFETWFDSDDNRDAANMCTGPEFYEQNMWGFGYGTDKTHRWYVCGEGSCHCRAMASCSSAPLLSTEEQDIDEEKVIEEDEEEDESEEVYSAEDEVEDAQE